jgi:hypothetical protein
MAKGQSVEEDKQMEDTSDELKQNKIIMTEIMSLLLK